MNRFPSRCSSSLILCLSLLLPACSGGGGGTATGTTPPAPRIAGTAVYLSQDGLHLMGVPDDAGRSAVELSTAPFTGIQQFAVSPDGSAVAYLADGAVQDQYELFVREFSGNAPVKVSTLTNGFDDVFDFAWAPDGQSLAYRADATVDDRAELFRVDRDGSHGYRVFQGTANDIVVGSGYQWSSDSRYLAFVLVESGVPDDLRLHDASTAAEGATQVLQVAGGRQIVDVSFSPNGQWIAMRSDQAYSVGQYEVFRAPTDGSTGPIRSNGTVTPSVQLGAYAWSADSRYLAQEVRGFPTPTTLIGVNVFDTANDASTRIVTTSDYGRFAWSPQGHQLALCADFVPGAGPSGAQALLRLDAGNYALTTLSNAMGNGEALRPDLLAWSPDSARIAYATMTNSNFHQQAYLVELTGGAAAVPVTGTMNLEVTTLAWSGDGMHLGLLERDQTQAFHPGQWYLLDNAGTVRWSSGSVMTYDSSHAMRWTRDDARAVYAVAGNGATSDGLHSVKADGSGAVVLSGSEADANEVFELASAPLPQ